MPNIINLRENIIESNYAETGGVISSKKGNIYLNNNRFYNNNAIVGSIFSKPIDDNLNIAIESNNNIYQENYVINDAGIYHIKDI